VKLRYNPRVARKVAILAAVALTIIVTDQWTKYLVVRDLTTAMDNAPTLGARVKVLYSAAPPNTAYDPYHYAQKKSITVSEKFFRVRYAENTGAAFGMFRSLPERVRGPLFHLVSILAVVLITHLFLKLPGKDPSERWAVGGLSLILGGALGNYIDRLARGFVIDFLEAHWFDKAYWPSFNVADSAICVGIGMLILEGFLKKKETPQVAESPSPGDRAAGTDERAQSDAR
jgi:signal peptidase II